MTEMNSYFNRKTHTQDKEAPTMINHPFKVGDTVRCLGDSPVNDLSMGDRFVVTELLDDTMEALIRVAGRNKSYYAYRFEKVPDHPFEVGDIVRCVETSLANDLVKGDRFVVSALQDNGYGQTLVRLFGRVKSYYADRFEKAPQEEEEVDELCSKLESLDAQVSELKELAAKLIEDRDYLREQFQRMVDSNEKLTATKSKEPRVLPLKDLPFGARVCQVDCFHGNKYTVIQAWSLVGGRWFAVLQDYSGVRSLWACVEGEKEYTILKEPE